MLEEAGYGLVDGGGFIAGWDDGGDGWPGGWRFVLCEIVVEFAETPEHASGEREIEPDGQRDRRECERDRGHRAFWRSRLRGYNGRRGLN